LTADTKKRHISNEDAEEAVKTLLQWMGEDIEREGLVETPKRVIKSFAEKFAGYKTDPKVLLSKKFSETSGYKGIVMLSDITVESHCEHHMSPIIGRAYVAYLPSDKVVGISKIARLVEVFSKRLQLQERMTAQIANAIDENLEPKGVAVLIEAKHHCICHRGVNHRDTMMMTSSFLGEFKTDEKLMNQFILQVKKCSVMHC
jgi:GTP cyclohydrolase I